MEELFKLILHYDIYQVEANPSSKFKMEDYIDFLKNLTPEELEVHRKEAQKGV